MGCRAERTSLNVRVDVFILRCCAIVVAETRTFRDVRSATETNNLKRERIAGNLIRGPGSQKLADIVLHRAADLCGLSCRLLFSRLTSARRLAAATFRAGAQVVCGHRAGSDYLP